MFRQLLYVSQQSRALNDDDLKNLLSEARRLNSTHQITGVLIKVSAFFVQCIEGPKDEIEQLAHNISIDARNQQFHILSDKDVTDRAFSSWHMGYKTLSIDEMRSEPGFMDINDENGLDVIKECHREAFDIMHAYYSSI